MTKPKSSTALARRPARKSKRKSGAARAIPQPSIYSVHPGVAMMQRWIGELKAKTGRTLPEWIRHIKAAGPTDEKTCRVWLKDTYGLGTNCVWWLAAKTWGNPLGLADDDPKSYLAACPGYVDALYSGPKAALRPIHDELIRLARELGDDLRICPCQTIVPLYRRHVFAQIRPATSKRIDLGLALDDEPFTVRLVDTGGRAKRDRITHRVSLTALDDIDLQVKRWLKQAFGRDE